VVSAYILRENCQNRRDCQKLKIENLRVDEIAADRQEKPFAADLRRQAQMEKNSGAHKKSKRSAGARRGDSSRADLPGKLEAAAPRKTAIGNPKIELPGAGPLMMMRASRAPIGQG
jgi:hypothetical protein